MAIDPIAGLQAVSTALSTLGSIASLAKQARAGADASALSELNDRILDLQEQMIGLQKALIDFHAENASLKDQLKKAADDSALRQRMRFEETVYWEIKNDGTHDGPFCPNCWDHDYKPVRLNRASDGGFFCPFHKTTFETSDSRRGPLVGGAVGESVFGKDFLKREL